METIFRLLLNLVRVGHLPDLLVGLLYGNLLLQFLDLHLRNGDLLLDSLLFVLLHLQFVLFTLLQILWDDELADCI